MKNTPKKTSIFSLFLSVILMVSMALPAIAQSNQKQITGDIFVNILDVGQADAIFVQLPNTQTMLIDAGNNDDSKEIIDYLNSKSIKKIDYLVATHPHEDHIGSMDDVVKNFAIGNVYMPKVTTTTKTYEDLLKEIKNKNLKVNTAKANIKLVDNLNLKVEMIAPISEKYDELNDYSSVIKLTYGNTSFLLTGDAEKISEDEILKTSANIKADVLKIGHHASESSTSDKFLKAVSPKFAVISCGKDNDYGFPKQAILDRLKANKTTLYRTDTQGTVSFKSDGKNISVTTSKKITDDTINFKAPPKIDTTTATAPAPQSTQKPTTTPKPNETPAVLDDTKSITVYITKTGEKYHVDGCRYLSKSKIPIELSKAKLSYTPCSVCNPPR